MHLTKVDYAGLGLAAFTAFVPVLTWAHLPPSVPVWWGFGLLPNIGAPKPWGPFILPIISAAIWVSTLVAARRGSASTQASLGSAASRTTQLAVQAFLLLLTLAPALVGTGLAASIDRVTMAGLGLLLIVVGNLQGKLQRNPFWGTRTAWALRDDEVWLLTQRLTGWLMIISGIALLVAGIADRGFAIASAVLAASVIASVFYSFAVHRRIAGSNKGERA